MLNRQQFSGVNRNQGQTNSTSLRDRIDPEERPLPQVEYEKQVTPQETQDNRQVWSQQMDIPPQAPVAVSRQAEAMQTAMPPQGPNPVQQSNQQKNTPENTDIVDEKDYFEHLPKPMPEETIFSWKSASRPFKKRNRQFYTTIAAIVILISLILFFAGQMLPIAVVISIAFLYYVLSSVPPDETEKKITTYGIRVEDQLYYWEEMGRFWFDEKYGADLLQIEIVRFPGRLTFLLGNANKEELEEILKEVLIKEKPKDTFYDRSAKWLQEKVPLE